MKKISYFLLGCITTLIVMHSTVVFAKTTQTIEVIWGQIKLVVNGSPLDKETLLYNGTTYVPLRAAAEVFDKEVAWDGNLDTAYIDEKGTARQVAIDIKNMKDDSNTNLYPLMRRNFSEVRELFGNELSGEEGVLAFYDYVFDTGLTVGINEHDEIISLHIVFGDNNLGIYHFIGIDNNSTYADVVNIFGNTDNVREDADGKSYGYWLEGHEFVWFSVDTNSEVIYVSFFLGERPSAE